MECTVKSHRGMRGGSSKCVRRYSCAGRSCVCHLRRQPRMLQRRSMQAAPQVNLPLPLRFNSRNAHPTTRVRFFNINISKFLGETFHDVGFNTGITRYLNDWFGLEGTVAWIWKRCHTLQSQCEICLHRWRATRYHANGTRFEPWGHVLWAWSTSGSVRPTISLT